MARKQEPVDFLDDDQDQKFSESLSGHSTKEEIDIPADLTMGKALEQYFSAREAHEAASAVAKESKREFDHATYRLYMMMENNEPPMKSVSIDGGKTVTRYTLTVGSLIGGEDAAIEGIKRDGLEDRLVKETVIKGELNSFVKELIDNGEAFPEWARPFEIQKISLTTSKKKGA